MDQATIADVAQFLLQQLHVVFFTSDNAERQAAFQALDACDGYQSGTPGVTSQVLIGAALEVLKRETEPPQVRAYGAQLLTRHLEQLVGMVSGDTGSAIIDTTMSMIPYVDIAAWMVAADRSAMVYGNRMAGGDIGSALRPAHHHKAVASACGNLIATCVAHQWPDKGGQALIDTICPAGNSPSLASLPNTLRVVLDMVRICAEPPYRTLSNQRISQIKRGLISIAPNVSKAAIAALDQQYTYLNAVIAGRPGTAGLGDCDEAVQAVCGDMEAAIEILALTCTRTTPLIQHWWDLNVDAVFTAIVSLASQWASKMGGGGQRDTSNGSSPITMVCAAIDLVTTLTCSLSTEAFEAVCTESNSMEPISRLVQLISSVLYLADSASDVSQSLDNRFIAEKVGKLLVEGGDKITLLDTYLDKLIPDRPSDSPLRIRRTAAIAASLLLRIPSVVIGTMAVQSLSTFLRVDIATVASIVDSVGRNLFFSPTSEGDRGTVLANIRQLLDMSFDVPSILDHLAVLCKKNALNPWKTHPRGNGSQEFIPLCPIDHPNNAQREHFSKLSTLAFTIAQDEFLEMEQYTVAYGELRTAISNLLQGLATMFPASSGEFLKALVHESLQLSPAQRGAEPSTRHGHVTQHGEVFPRWEACAYMLSTMLDGVSRSPFASIQQGAQLFTSLYNSIIRSPLVDTTTPTMDGGGEAEVFPDAVLAPQYLNCVFHFLRCGAHGIGSADNKTSTTASPSNPSEVSCQAIMMPKSPLVVVVESGLTAGFEVGYQDVVRHSLDVISAFMDLRCGSLRGARVFAFREDEDLISARKRSFTLLISIGDTFDSLMTGAGVAGSLVGTISRLMMTGERLLPTERTLLIEAVACLSTSIDGLMGFLGTYLRGLLCEIDVLHGRVDPDRLAYLLITSNSADISAFSGAKEAIDTVAKVLKRCKPSDSLRELVMGTMDPIGVMTLSLHQLSPDHFPQEFKSVIDPVSHEEHNQLKSGGGVKRPANLNSAVERVRKTLTWLRRTVYDYVTCMARFVPADTFGTGVVRMTDGSENLPPQAMSDFLSMCLYPLAISEPQFVSLALTTASSYLTAIKSRIGADVIDAVLSRQLFYLSKDLAAFIYAVSIGGCGYEAAKKVLVMKSGPGAALAVVPPKEATLPFLGSSDGIDVVLAALQCVLFDGHDLKSAFTLSLLVWNTLRNRRNATPNTDPSQIQQIMELMCKVFAVTVVGTMTNPFVDRPDTRSSLAGYLCDLYMAEFPRLTSAFTTSYPFIPDGKALVALDAPHTDSKSTSVETLHARMVAGRTDRHKRDLFTSFIHDTFGVVSAPISSSASSRGGGGK